MHGLHESGTNLIVRFHDRIHVLHEPLNLWVDFGNLVEFVSHDSPKILALTERGVLKDTCDFVPVGT